jgi:hypothetical protein
VKNHHMQDSQGNKRALHVTSHAERPRARLVLAF